MRKGQPNALIVILLLVTAVAVLGSPVVHTGLTHLTHHIAKAGPLDQPISALADAFEYVVLSGILILPVLLVVRRFEFRAEPACLYTAHFQPVFVRPPPVH